MSDSQNNMPSGTLNVEHVPTEPIDRTIIGEKDGEKSIKYNLCESLGVSWSDSYQTSYGWQPDNGQIHRTQSGPIVPTLSGDGNGGCNSNNHGYNSLRGCTKTFLPDQRHASSCYTWMGYWTIHNKNNYGATSIWFK